MADWALKRVLKFVLKRSLGRYLTNEVDLSQLDVQLGSGTLELRDVLLNCEHINQQLVSEVAQGCAGRSPRAWCSHSMTWQTVPTATPRPSTAAAAARLSWPSAPRTAGSPATAWSGWLQPAPTPAAQPATFAPPA